MPTVTENEQLAQEILPYLRRAVMATVERWEAERAIEHILNRDMDRLGDLVSAMAVGAGKPKDTTLEDALELVEESSEEVDEDEEEDENDAH